MPSGSLGCSAGSRSASLCTGAPAIPNTPRRPSPIFTKKWNWKTNGEPSPWSTLNNRAAWKLHEPAVELDRQPAMVLDTCDREGAVRIRRRSGRTYTLHPDRGPDYITE